MCTHSVYHMQYLLFYIIYILYIYTRYICYIYCIYIYTTPFTYTAKKQARLALEKRQDERLKKTLESELG